MTQSILLNELSIMVSGQKERLHHIKTLSPEILKQPIAEGKWSIEENLEHLLRYGDFYLPEVKRRMKGAIKKSSDNYKSGRLGKYFTESMKPGSKPMNTFRSMNPALSSDVRENPIELLDAQLGEWLIILDALQNIDIQKTKTSISISKWIKLRMGDTLGVVIWHQERHFSYFLHY